MSSDDLNALRETLKKTTPDTLPAFLGRLGRLIAQCCRGVDVSIYVDEHREEMAVAARQYLDALNSVSDKESAAEGFRREILDMIDVLEDELSLCDPVKSLSRRPSFARTTA